MSHAWRLTGAVATLVVAALLAAITLGLARSGGAELSAPPATALVAPSTIAPVAPSSLAPTAPPTLAPTAPHPPSTAATVDATAPSTSLPMSPLADVVGAPQPAIPTASVVMPPPTHLAISAIGASAPIRPVGVQLDGQLEVPDETEVGWYALGSAPGATGATVLAAHVNWHGRPGPFLRLLELEPGVEVSVALADGTVRTYSVTERAQYPKTMIPHDRVWTRTGPETLVLITCGGDFDSTVRRFRDNVVVYAVPVAAGEVPS